MKDRNLSTVEYFNRLARRLPPPALTFRGSTKEEWNEWRNAFRAKLRELCGEWPHRVPLNPETVYRLDTDDGLILDRPAAHSPRPVAGRQRQVSRHPLPPWPRRVRQGGCRRSH